MSLDGTAQLVPGISSNLIRVAFPMPSIMQVVFFVFAFAVLGGWHYYLWARFVRDLQPAERWLRAGKSVFCVLAIAVPFTMIAGRFLDVDVLRPAFVFGFVWLGLSFILVMLLLIVDIVRLAEWGVRRLTRSKPISLERRRFIKRVVAGVVAFSGLANAAGGAASALGTAVVEKVPVRLRRLSKKMSGTRIVQLTDMHIGSILQRAWVEKVVAQVQALNADLIVITGDLVDGSVDRLREHVAPLGELRARHGVYFVTGNHEFYSGAEAWIPELARLGIRTLRNEHVMIGEGDDAFCLAGVDDWSTRGRRNGKGHDVAAAVRGVDPSREVVLLAHQPRTVGDAVKHGVGLQLSGHTHGGQIYPWHSFVLFQQPFVSGLHQVEGTWVYVSRGTGFWGPPIRLAAPPEITSVELMQA